MSVVLSVIIGTRNRLSALTNTLDSLRGKIRCSHEIIVIDAGSTDGTLEYLSRLDDVTFVNDRKLLGQAKSLNQVIQSLSSRYVCWLSDDNVVAEGMLDTAVGILEDNPKVGMVSLKVKDMTGNLKNLPYIGGVWAGILNCNQGMLPTRLMQEVGGFDEDIRDYGIDIDLATRVLLYGYQVVLTKKVAVYHYRNHEANAWIDAGLRKERLGNSRELYKRKYGYLLTFVPKGGLGLRDKKSPVIPLIDSLYRIARRRGVSFEKFFGINERDWRNLFSCYYISVFDFFLNFGKPYYLVQQISTQNIKRLKRMGLKDDAFFERNR